MTLAGLVLTGSLLGTAPAQKVAHQVAHQVAHDAAQDAALQAEALLHTVKPSAQAWHMAAGLFAHWSKKPQVGTPMPDTNNPYSSEQDQKPS